MDKCAGNSRQVNSGVRGSDGSCKKASPKNRNIVRDLRKESSLSSDDTEFMDLPLPALPKTVEDLAQNRRSIVEVDNLDVHPCVAAFLMSRMEYYIGWARNFLSSLLRFYRFPPAVVRELPTNIICRPSWGII